MAFEQIIQTMSEMGILQLFFPWLLITALTFGALNKYDVFEEESVIGAVSISVGFIALSGIYIFVPANLFANFGAAIAFAFFGLLGLALFMGMAGVEVGDIDDPKKNPVAAAGILMILIAFIGVLVARFDLNFILEGINSAGESSVLMQILTLLFIIIIVAIVAGGGD